MKCVVVSCALAVSLLTHQSGRAEEKARQPLRLEWKDNILQITAAWVPGKTVRIWYLEAYCRPGSTDRDWKKTVIPHKTRLISAKDDGSEIKLECTLEDGVVVQHVITGGEDSVEFKLTAYNPTTEESAAHWAQPCIRVGEFTGTAGSPDKYAYVPKCFIFLDGKAAFLPTHPWAKKARYTPGQVWRPKHVDADDVNPRPLSTLTPSNGLIGCVSADGKWLLATAWEPWQELFQGVIRCIHNDFRIGGLKPAEKKTVRGKLWIMPKDFGKLVERYNSELSARKNPS